MAEPAQLPPTEPPEAPQNGDMAAEVSGTLVAYDGSCSRVPYAFGVVQDAAGVRHFFGRVHLGRGVVAEALRPGQPLEFRVLAGLRASWAYSIRKPLGGRRARETEGHGPRWGRRWGCALSARVTSSEALASAERPGAAQAPERRAARLGARLALGARLGGLARASARRLAKRDSGDVLLTELVRRSAARPWERRAQSALPVAKRSCGEGARQAAAIAEGPQAVSASCAAESTLRAAPGCAGAPGGAASRGAPGVAAPLGGTGVPGGAAAGLGAASASAAASVSMGTCATGAASKGASASAAGGAWAAAAATGRRSGPMLAEEVSLPHLVSTLLLEASGEAAWKATLEEYFALPLRALFDEELAQINRVIDREFKTSGLRGRPPQAVPTGVELS